MQSGQQTGAAVSDGKCRNVVLVTDRYWPALGGVEHWVHAVSLLLPADCNVRIVALANDCHNGDFLNRTVLPPKFDTYLDEAGHEVHPLLPSPPGRLALYLLILWRLPFVRRCIPRQMFTFLYCFFKVGYFKPLNDLLRGADVVHCFSTSFLAVCVSDACRKLRIPLIHAPSVHFGRWGDGPLLLRAYSQAAILISQTEFAREEFRRHLSRQLPQIRLSTPPLLPMCPEESPPVPIDGPFILFLGRRESHKGLQLLLSAFGKLASKVTLVVAGPGTPLIVAMEKPVVDLGAVSDGTKQWLLSHCTVFCVPSLDESFGIVYIEAMRCAKPIVALDVSPVNELVENGVSGVLVPPDSPGLLASAIDRLLGSEELRARIASGALRRYEDRFAADKVIAELVGMYDEVVSGVHVGGRFLSSPN